VLDQLIGSLARNAEAMNLIHGGSPADYARAVIDLIQSIEKGADPGSRLRQWALTHMTWEIEAAKIAQLYVRLQGKQPAGNRLHGDSRL
jgi:hypothetical protein